MQLKLLLICFFGLAISACVKNDDYQIPDITAPVPEYTGSIISFAQLKAKTSSSIATYTDDEAVEGYVISSDEGRNITKKLYLQNADNTQGIVIALADEGIYTQFPLGSKVRVLLKDLSFQLNNAVITIGYDTYKSKKGYQSVGYMPKAIVEKHLFALGEKKTVAQLTTTLNSLEVSDADVGKLFSIKNVQFEARAVGKLFYVSNKKSGAGTNYKLIDSNGKSLLLRTSNSALFKDEKVPAGKVRVTGILSKFGKDYQLMISYYSDLQF